MKANTRILTIVASFAAGIVVTSAVGGWNFMTAQSVTGMHGEDGSASGGVPQEDPAGSTNREPGAASSSSSQSTQGGGDTAGSGPTDGMVQPLTGESVSAVDSTGEEDGEWSEWDPTLDDPPPDPHPTKVPPPPIREVQPSATDGNWPNGINGVNGLNGINGVNGLNGLNGINGINGINWPNGINGINGINGLNGINGTNAVRSTSQTQVGGVTKRKPWWKDLGRGPAPLETVVPEAWQKIPRGGVEAESEDFDEEEEPWSSFTNATEPSDDEEGMEEGDGDEERGEDVASKSAPAVSETVLSWVRDAIAFLSGLFSY